MNRFASGLVAVLLILPVPGSVAAAAATNEHGTNQFTWVDDDFCGTGVAVRHDFTETFTVHFAPDVFRVTSENQDVVTNEQTGDAIVGSAAGTFTGRFSSGEPAGLHTLTFTHAGLQELIKTAHGAVLIADVGYVVSVVTFDGDQFISDELVVERGQHPELDSAFSLFCEVAVPALGIG
jgi:hypothetical protein